MTMDTILFNDITVGRLVPWLAAVAVVYAALKIYKALFGKKKGEPSAYRLFCLQQLWMGRPYQQIRYTLPQVRRRCGGFGRRTGITGFHDNKIKSSRFQIHR